MKGGVIKNITVAEKTLFTLRLPEQPQVGREGVKPSEVQIVIFSEGHESYRGFKNALNLLDVLYTRGVTSSDVLSVLLEATGHPVIEADSGASENLETSTPEGADHDR